MFTGIVTDVGVVQEVVPLDQGLRFKISTKYNLDSLKIGDSICCSGICLTVVDHAPCHIEEKWFEVEAWEETIRLTNVRSWHLGTKINLEQSLCLGDQIGGHLVSGHVDGLAEIVRMHDEGDARRIYIKAPHDLARFIAPKGSIALNGTSLTVNSVEQQLFDILLIKHTLDVTTWGDRKVGDKVNIEIDQLARYVERLMTYK